MKRLLFVLSVCLCIYLNVNYAVGQEDETETTTFQSTSTTTNATVTKVSRKVNWTEVEEKWNQVLEDDVVYEKWKRLDENLKNGRMLKEVLVYIFKKILIFALILLRYQIIIKSDLPKSC